MKVEEENAVFRNLLLMGGIVLTIVLIVGTFVVHKQLEFKEGGARVARDGHGAQRMVGGM